MVSWSGIEVSWSDGLTIRRKEEVKRTSADRVAAREAAARKKVEEYEKKIKRNQNLLKKWKGKVAYYDRKNRAAAQKE
jgi:superfamily I DNA and RNA helicase